MSGDEVTILVEARSAEFGQQRDSRCRGSYWPRTAWHGAAMAARAPKSTTADSECDRRTSRRRRPGKEVAGPRGQLQVGFMEFPLDRSSTPIRWVKIVRRSQAFQGDAVLSGQHSKPRSRHGWLS